jgi:hypothetical protein
MLDDWQVSYRPEFQGVRVVGHQWSPHSTEIRDFLGRNFVPHQWLNVRMSSRTCSNHFSQPNLSGPGRGSDSSSAIALSGENAADFPDRLGSEADAG